MLLCFPLNGHIEEAPLEGKREHGQIYFFFFSLSLCHSWHYPLVFSPQWNHVTGYSFFLLLLLLFVLNNDMIVSSDFNSNAEENLKLRTSYFSKGYHLGAFGCSVASHIKRAKNTINIPFFIFCIIFLGHMMMAINKNRKWLRIYLE